MKKYYVRISDGVGVYVYGDALEWDGDLWIIKDDEIVAYFKEWDYWYEVYEPEKVQQQCY